jgi:hypothetical protein
VKKSLAALPPFSAGFNPSAAVARFRIFAFQSPLSVFSLGVPNCCPLATYHLRRIAASKFYLHFLRK